MQVYALRYARIVWDSCWFVTSPFLHRIPVKQRSSVSKVTSAVWLVVGQESQAFCENKKRYDHQMIIHHAKHVVFLVAACCSQKVTIESCPIVYARKNSQYQHSTLDYHDTLLSILQADAPKYPTLTMSPPILCTSQTWSSVADQAITTCPEGFRELHLMHNL